MESVNALAEEVTAEAGRGMCFECDNCVIYCPTGYIEMGLGG